MGHRIGKDIYRELGEKIDSLPYRSPWDERLHAVLSELYSTEEADVIIKMPYGLSNIDRIEKITKYEGSELRKILESLCSKGLVIDLWVNGDYHYFPSPMLVGIYELTMMRTGNNLNTKKWARLFNEYLLGDNFFFGANSKNGERVSVVRTLPHEDAILPSEYMEILDYEKAAALIEETDKFAIGLCSCRHQKLHLGEKQCDVPLETCSSFGLVADYLIRNKLAEEVSRTEMMENLARSKEMGLVLNADNVRKNITFLCHCCKCCCNAMLGITKFGYPNIIVTSSFIVKTDEEICTGCGVCVEACPINAVKMLPAEDSRSKKKKMTDTAICLGCGVCVLKCRTGAVKLVKRKKRVIHPETTFERIILQSLERGTLQNQLFDNSQSITQKFMRGFIGAFLRLTPVKKALMSDLLRSTFLGSMKIGSKMQGKGWMTEM